LRVLDLVANAALLIKSQLSVSFFLSIFIQNLIDLLVLEQQEADLLKAQKEARRALRKKKELQKANQMANLPSDGEGEYLPRPIPTVSSMFFFVST
jgi:hypothetical protein